MSWQYHSNTILSGLLDYYCLSCEQHFQSDGDVNDHLVDKEHITNLQNSKYLEQYENHGIRQLKKVYHCQFCNKLISTRLQVKAHVDESYHIRNIILKTTKRQNNDTKVVINNIVIDENSWHGVIDKCCVICNKDVETEEHTTEKEHILNLIRSEVLFDNGGNIFRQLQHSDVQCLSCNVLLDAELASTHFEQPTHKAALIKHAASSSDQSLNQGAIDIKTIEGESFVRADTSENTFENVEEIRRDEEDPVANDDAIEDDSAEEKYGHNMQLALVTNEANQLNPNRTEDLIQEEDRHTFAKKNYIILSDNRQATCKVCKNTISSALKCLKEHVSGAKHKINLQRFQQENRQEQVNASTARYYKVATVDYLEESLIHMNGHIFLDEFSLPKLNFHIVTSMAGVNKCHVCENNFPPILTEKHIDGNNNHIRKLKLVPVVTKFHGEFFREIRPDVFHCGFCNCLIVGFHMIPQHQLTSEHKNHKMIAFVRHRAHLPIVKHVRILRVFRLMGLM